LELYGIGPENIEFLKTKQYNMPKNKIRSTNQPDLVDSNRDLQQLKPDRAQLDLPDVKDIPGQEHIVPPLLAEYTDTTISSDDEEGKGLLDETDLSDKNVNVSSSERKLIDQAFGEFDPEEEPLDELALDSKDADGQSLNEKGLKDDLFGEDLDSPLADEEDDEGDDSNHP
jgi:hypothetical protein